MRCVYTLLRVRVCVHLKHVCVCVVQVVNGLMDRPDWEKAIQTPVGILPGGSGNGLAASVHHYTR